MAKKRPHYKSKPSLFNVNKTKKTQSQQSEVINNLITDIYRNIANTRIQFSSKLTEFDKALVNVRKDQTQSFQILDCLPAILSRLTKISLQEIEDIIEEEIENRKVISSSGLPQGTIIVKQYNIQ